MYVRLDSEWLENNTSVEQLITNFNYKFPFRDSIEHKSKVSHKPCCNDLCEVAILKELVDRTVERDYTKATNASVHKKVYESVFKYVLLNCTLNRDVCKRTWYNPI